MVKKAVTRLDVKDFQNHPVWKYLWGESDKKGDTLVEPAQPLPVKRLSSQYVVCTPVRLANGSQFWAMIENITTNNPQSTAHFIVLCVVKDGRRIFLGRYFDPWYDDMSPENFAKSLGMNVDDVFPISYDVQPYVEEQSPSHTGLIPKEPSERLSDDELMALSRDKPDRVG